MVAEASAGSSDFWLGVGVGRCNPETRISFVGRKQPERCEAGVILLVWAVLQDQGQEMALGLHRVSQHGVGNGCH